MQIVMTEAEWKKKIHSGEFGLIPLIGGGVYDPCARNNWDGTITRFDTPSEARQALCDEYFAEGMLIKMIITTHQTMLPDDPEAYWFTSSWGWKGKPWTDAVGRLQQPSSPPEPFSDVLIQEGRKEANRLYQETGRTTTLWECWNSSNRALYSIG